MSSDDSSAEQDGRKYTVFTRKWLNPMVRLFFLRLDQGYLLLREMEKNRYTPGNLPHRRIRPPANTHISTRYAVPFLPINMYDPTWYNGLSSAERNALKATPTEYDLAFPPAPEIHPDVTAR